MIKEQIAYLLKAFTDEVEIGDMPTYDEFGVCLVGDEEYMFNVVNGVVTLV